MYAKFIYFRGPLIFKIKKAGEPNYNKQTPFIRPGLWNKIIDSKNNKILLSTSGGLELAIKLLKKKNLKTMVYILVLFGVATLKDLQQEQINSFDHCRNR